MISIKIKYCPGCGSRRIQQLVRQSEAYCRRCKTKFAVVPTPIDSCEKCHGAIIDRHDPLKATLMGNNKIRHVRCPRGKRRPELTA